MHRLLRALPCRLERTRSSRFLSITINTTKIFTDDTDYASIRIGDPAPGDANESLKGWKLATKRAHDVIGEVTDNQFTKALHVYPDTEFVLGFGKSTKFSFAACTSSEDVYDNTKDMIQYQDKVSLVDFTQPIPYRYHTFQLVIALPHPERDCARQMVPLAEIARVLNEGGFGIIGGTSRMWRNGMSEALDSLHNSEKLKVLSLQHTELDEHECLYYMAVIRGI